MNPCARSTTSTMTGVHASIEPRTDTRSGYLAAAMSSRLVKPSRSATANPSRSSWGSTAIVATSFGALNGLDDEHLAAAEELILAAGLAGKTPGQIARIAARAVVTVDPDGARRRRG